MKQPPSNQPPDQAFTASGSFPMSHWLKPLGLLVLGIGLGAVGAKWLMPQTDVSSQRSGALEVEAPSDPANIPGLGLPEWDTPNSAASRSTLSAAKVADATVCVKTYGPSGGQACASGVAIDPQLVGVDPDQGSVVLTNYHVIAEPIAGLPVQLGGKGEIFRSQVLKQSPERDLALLLVPRAQFPSAALADSSPASGTAVRAIGFPNNQPLTIKDSTLLGETGNCLAVSPCLAMEQGTITHGNSGGPLEANEQVIGITEGETSDEIAIPVEQVHQFLSDEASNERTPMRRFVAPDRVPPQFERGFPPMDEPHYHVPPPMGEPYPPQGWL